MLDCFWVLSGVPNLDNYHIVLKSLPSFDQRVYNKPTNSQVAALWVKGEEIGETGKRDIRVHTHSGSSKNIQYYYGCYDLLQYPLMFPFGDLGWYQGIPKKGIRVQTKKQKKTKLQLNLFIQWMSLVKPRKNEFENPKISNFLGFIFFNRPPFLHFLD